jgi:hypothetical protein
LPWNSSDLNWIVVIYSYKYGKFAYFNREGVWGKEVYSLSLTTATRDGDEWSAERPSRFTPGAYRVRGWDCHRVGLAAWEMTQISRPSRKSKISGFDFVVLKTGWLKICCNFHRQPFHWSALYITDGEGYQEVEVVLHVQVMNLKNFFKTPSLHNRCYCQTQITDLST